MAKCGYCNSTVIFGGVKTQEKGERYCNNKCYNSAVLLAVADQIPPETINEQIQQVHQGLCPKCKGGGPIDVHIKYQVWSALLLTSWSNHPQVSCRSCGRKNQLFGVVSSLLFGWWGFPWGPIMTPVQVTRNVIGMLKGPDELRPSPMLERLVRLGIASQLVQQSQPGSN
ncbi:MAG TPA: hypothetical protein VLH08_19945 [Acidobacteriota bacterium]|nr:hypothetical protein [Acidobacteriota bacterium]